MEDQSYVWGVWQDAFCKFGYNDGDGFVRSYDVAKCLKQAGYDVAIGNHGIHNTVINSIKQNSTELLPLNDPRVRFGYDNPRKFLPETIITLLDEVFSSDAFGNKIRDEINSTPE